MTLVEELFGINLRVMQILGFYPPQKYRRIYKLYSVLVYCVFTAMIPILASLYIILDKEINLDKVSDSAFIIGQLGCFIVKMLPFVFKGDQIRTSIYMVENPIFTAYTEKQQKLINNCKNICKRCTVVYVCMVIGCIIAWGLTPLFDKHIILPINVWLPYKLSAKYVYFFSFIYVLAGAGNGAISNGAIDPLIAGLACFASTQIEILKDNLQRIGDCPELGEIRHKFKVCVIHHNAILDFVANYEKNYSPIVFTQFSASVLVICICCFKLSQVPLFSINFIWMILFLLIMLTEIFLYCYFGTMLFEENKTLIEAVYMTNWYKYDVELRKSLLLLMERSKQPMIVTAGKILNLSLGTFTTILRRAYSLLALLKNY